LKNSSYTVQTYWPKLTKSIGRLQFFLSMVVSGLSGILSIVLTLAMRIGGCVTMFCNLGLTQKVVGAGSEPAPTG